ncbi:MAG: BamA/TamA family outer membrane protein [Phycisphaerales bacterium]
MKPRTSFCAALAAAAMAGVPPMASAQAPGPTGGGPPPGATGATGATGPAAAAGPMAAADPVGSLEGRPIASVTLRRPVEGREGEHEPLTGALEQLARNQVRSAAGAPLSRATVTQDISRLNRIGRFRTIRVEAQPLADGSAALVYTLTEQPLVEDVQVVGNRELSDQEILGALVTVIAGAPVDRFNIDRGARQIEDLYRARGFSAARVHVDERELEGSAIVIYRVIEGERVRVTAIEFVGNNSFTARELRPQIKTTTFIPLIEKAPLDDLVLGADLRALSEFYRDRGHLDVRVGVRTQLSLDGKEAKVVFDVDEGPLYTLRSIQPLYIRAEDIQRYRVEVLKDAQADVPYLTPEQMRQIGKRAYDAEQMSGMMSVKPGDVYSEARVRLSLLAIREAYGKLGYVVDHVAQPPVTVRIEPNPVRDERRPEVDLILLIEEGVPYLTGEVSVTGNERTKQQVIMRQVQVRPERPLDKTALDETQRRLEQLRLFKPGSVRVTMQPPAPSAPGHRDPLIEVAEDNTGEINFGAAIDTDAGVVGRFSIVQRNFDPLDPPESLADLPTSFRGAGQTASLELLPGTNVQTYLISLHEPYLLETNFSAGGKVLYYKRDYREFDEERYGGDISLGRRFGSQWRAELQLRNQWIQLSDIDEDAAADIFEFEDQRRVSALGLVLRRTTADNPYRPSSGMRLSLGAEQAGVLGGDFDFTKLSAEYTGFFSLYESFLGYKTVLKVEQRVGWIPTGQDSAPVYERLNLGGQSFRGFAVKGVSPRGLQRNGMPSDDAVGGSWMYFLGAEVNQPVYEDVMSVVGFVDTGTVEERFGFSEYRVSVGVGFRLYVRQLSPIPLAFDFGFPVLKEDSDRTRLFTFSVDVPF